MRRFARNGSGPAPGGDDRAGAADRRPAPSHVGPAGQPLPVPGFAGGCRQRPQHRRDLFRGMPRDVSRGRPAGAEILGRDRVRQRHRGDERVREIRQDPLHRRHHRQCRFADRQPRQGHPRTARHPARMDASAASAMARPGR